MRNANLRKRILSILLCLAMVVALLPLMAEDARAELVADSVDTGETILEETDTCDLCGEGDSAHYAEYENGFCTECDGYEPCEGEGTEESPYLIGNAGNLYWFAQQVNSGNADIWGTLTANITVNTGVLDANGSLIENDAYRVWTPIGFWNDNEAYYSGTFDGQNYTISGLYINRPSVKNACLFDCVYHGGVVKNVSLVDSYFCGSYYVAGIVGDAWEATIENCHSAATVYGYQRVGGVIGSADDVTVKNCSNSGDVTGNWAVGGVVGSCYDGVVENCTNSGNITGYDTEEYKSEDIGGVVGWAKESTFTGCSNSGNITGYYDVGGVIGGVLRTTVTNSFNTGAVTGGSKVGDIVGYRNSATVSNCYYLAEEENKDGGKTEAQFASGEVAYLLNDDQTNIVWKQTIGVDQYPGFTGETVYKLTNIGCQAAADKYSNNSSDTYAPAHVYDKVVSVDDQYHANQCACGATDEATKAAHNEVKVEAVAPTCAASGWTEGSCCSFCGHVFVAQEEIPKLAHTIDNDGFCTVCGDYQPCEGEGTEESPYLIGNAGQLYWFAAQVNGGDYDACGKLTADIDVNPGYSFTYLKDTNLVEVKYNDAVLAYLGVGIGDYTMGTVYLYTDGTYTAEALEEGESSVLAVLRAWTPMGYCSSEDVYVEYAGTFDGGNFTISGLYFNDPSVDFVGLFVYIDGDDGGTVKNVHLTNGYFCGGEYVGGIVGSAQKATIENCHNAVTIVGIWDVGGIAGYASYNKEVTVTECTNSGIVCGKDYIGGIVGYTNNATVKDCFNSGAVYGIGDVGGIVGYTNNATVKDCSNSGAVYGIDYVGGIVSYTNNGTVKDCSNSGAVYGIDYVGGIVGGHGNGKATLTNCTNSGEITGDSYMGGIIGYTYGAQVTGCTNSGNITGSEDIGGVVGWAKESTFTDCSNSGDVSGHSYIGGLIADMVYTTATDCFNTGDVTGDKEGECVGGLTGVVNYNDDTTSALINSYNFGAVTGGTYVGGVVGYLNNGTVSNCYYLAEEENEDGGKTAEQFASGEVAYLLNGDQTNIVWKQTIGIDQYPGFTGHVVKFADSKYYNDDHKYENGFCDICGYQACEGEGTEESPYLIANAGNLYWFAQQVNSGNADIWGTLTANITVNTGVLDENGNLVESNDYRDWTPIGYYNDEDDHLDYAGTFDGQNYTISGLYLNDRDSWHFGLFGSIDGGTVKNVSLVDSYFCSDSYVAGIVGFANKATIANCHSAATLVGNWCVGGIAGFYWNSVVENCTNSGNLTGYDTEEYMSECIGGLIGWAYDSTLTGCSNSGDVSGHSYIGGLLGGVTGTTVTDCFNTGNVTGDEGSYYIGGLLGSLYYDDDTTSALSNSYNFGAVTGGTYVGGVVGYLNNGTVFNCYYLAEEENEDGGKTADQFASGEVAWLLNGNSTEGVWKQNLDNGEAVDTAPVLSSTHGTVYCGYVNCKATAVSYSNTMLATEQGTHIYENGFCVGCGNVPTGDNAHLRLWIALMVIAAGAILILTAFDRRQKRIAK